MQNLSLFIEVWACLGIPKFTLESILDADRVAVYGGPGMSLDSQAHSGVDSSCRSCRYLQRSGHVLQILSLFT